ncbi:MAG: urease accessory protein UreF [Pedosphaera sp.]|nr:urease accessory protein UreF [Pedosphaera sp.]
MKSEIAWLPQLLQTTDSIFPSGSYAHSFGLEGLVQLGQVAEPVDFAEFLRHQVVPAMEHMELPFVRLAHRAAGDADVSRLLELDEHYGAMKSSFELRQASSRIGTQRLQMLQKLTPHPLLAQLETECGRGNFHAHATIVFGAQAAIAQMPLEASLAAYFYQNLAALVSAAMKLIRMGQIAGQTILTECLAQTGVVVELALTVNEADIGWFQPGLDIASARHETAYTRIFIS